MVDGYKSTPVQLELPYQSLFVKISKRLCVSLKKSIIVDAIYKWAYTQKIQILQVR